MGYTTLIIFLVVWAGFIVFGTKKKFSFVQAWLGGFLVAVLAMFPLMIFISIFEPGESNNVQEIVKNDSWDASVSQVKGYLKANVNDPNSLEFVEWSQAIKQGDGFIVRCKYRGKNGFGALVLEEKLFYMDKTGAVTGSRDFTSTK